MKKVMMTLFLIFGFTLLFTSCSKEEKPPKLNKENTKSIIPDKDSKPGTEETSVQIKIKKDEKLDSQEGILIVRFVLSDSSDNKLRKLPNFRIKGPRRLEIDNSPSGIQKDAIHVFKLPVGRYSISSLYSINEKGEYEFDKPFPPNFFVIRSGMIHYIGDIKVRLIEERRSQNIYARKLKLNLHAENKETIEILSAKFEDLLKKFKLNTQSIEFGSY